MSEPSGVLGVGVDLCGIDRMRSQLEHETFLRRCFTEREIAYIRGRGAQAADSLAGLWAAKEAVLKALGTGLTVPMTDIEITHTDLGQPVCVLRGEALRLSRGGTLRLSITHEGDLAAAFCVWSVSAP